MLLLEESSAGGEEEEITTSTNVLVAQGELLSRDRKYFSEEKDLVGANSIFFSLREVLENSLFENPNLKNRRG